MTFNLNQVVYHTRYNELVRIVDNLLERRIIQNHDFELIVASLYTRHEFYVHNRDLKPLTELERELFDYEINHI